MILNNDNPSDKRQYPKHWDMIKGKLLFGSVDNRSVDGKEELLTVSHITGITPRRKKNVSMFMSESLVGYKIVHPDEIAANTMWMWQGAIGVSKYHGVISPSYNVYSQKKKVYDSDFLDLLLREKSLVDVYHSLSTGIRASRLRLYPEQLFSIKFPVPPMPEQMKIVKYVRWKTTEINQLLLALRKQFEKLQEAKQVVLYKAITKGIEDGTKYIDSGEACIGEIPEQWNICQLKYVAKIYNGNSISDNEKDDYTNVTSIPYIATKDVDLATSKANYDNGLYVPEDSSFKIAPKGSTLLCIEGGSAGKKKAYIDRNVAFVNKLCAFVAQKVNERFLFYYLSSPAFGLQFQKNITGLIGGVSISTIKSLLLPLPPEEEQKCIVKVLDSQCGEIDKRIALIKSKMEVLHELRNKLISDVVTGQIDVRDIEVPEFEYVEEIDDSSEDDEEADEEAVEEV